MKPVKQADSLAELAEVTESQVASILKSQRDLPRKLFPGTFDPLIKSIFVNSNLPQVKRDAVLYHEICHAFLSQTHYGEAITRLNNMSILLALALDQLRKMILMKTTLTSGLIKNLKDPQELMRFANDPKLRGVVRQALIDDGEFMEGIAIFAELEAKKNILQKHWQMCQEGYAYWATIYLYPETIKGNGIEAHKFADELRESIRRQGGENEVGLDLVERLSSIWGKNGVFPIIIWCLSSDLTQISLFSCTLDELKEVSFVTGDTYP